jgi:hypothetical protein
MLKCHVIRRQKRVNKRIKSKRELKGKREEQRKPSRVYREHPLPHMRGGGGRQRAMPAWATRGER